MSAIGITFLFIILILGLITLLHVRIRISIHSDLKTLFIGRGRTGILINLTDNTRSILIAGRTIETSTITKEKKPKKKPARTRPFGQILEILPDSFRAVTEYIYSLIKSVVLEEFEVEIKAGFPEPHLTGMAFGYYQASIAAVPFIGEHFKFVPNWNGGSISGTVRTTASIPLYKIIYRTIVLVFQLPLRKLVKLAIGRKVGYQDGTAK